MMRWLFIIALALLVGGSMIWLASIDPGFVLITYHQWHLETSLIVFIVMLMVLIITVYMLLRGTVALLGVRQNWSAWRLVQRRQKVHQSLTEGLLSLASGQWLVAEKALLRHASRSETPLLHYLSAARAAQLQGAIERRDNYLRLAGEMTTETDITTGVVHAELLIEAEQKEQALIILTELYQQQPKHPHVLRLLQQLYTELKSWHAIQGMLPDLRKRKILANDEVDELAVDIQRGQLVAATAEDDWVTVGQLWQDMPKKIRYQAVIMEAYINALMRQQREVEAAPLIEAFMNTQWSDALVYHYGLINLENGEAQLRRAQTWLKQNEKSAALLLTLGRLAAKTNDYRQAVAYMQQSLVIAERGVTYQALADLHWQQGDQKQAALESYRKGLQLMLS